MVRYKYLAAKDNKNITGEIDAPDEQMAAVLIRRLGLVPLSVSRSGKGFDSPKRKSKSAGGFFRAKKIKSRDITFITRQLATLLASGLPLARALGFVANQSANPTVKGLILSVESRIQGGATLSESLEEFPKQFDTLYLSMIRAGESAGIMDTILERLAFMRESKEELGSKVRGALIYPAFMFTAMAGCIGVLMGVVVPRFAMMFADMGQSLPLPTLILMTGANLVKDFWWLALVFGALAYGGFYHYTRTQDGLRRLDQVKLNLPMVGTFLLTVSMTRFCRTLGTLLASGVPLLNALASASGVSGNRAVQQAVELVTQEVKEGSRLGETMALTRIFPDYVVEMVMMGEESSTLDTMMIKVAQTCDREVDQLVKSLTSLVEPIMILCMGGVVGFIVMAMLFPIFQMNIMAG